LKQRSKYRFLFAGGGTGGHLFPAVAVAERIREKLPESEILFIGTKNKIEGTVVPKLGFNFKSIWVKGFSRGSLTQNVLFPVKLVVSAVQSMLINLKFQPGVAIGSGGYVAGPAIFGAHMSGAKVILIEPNSYPGVTTRLLEKYAAEIHIAFEESKKYLKQKNKIYLTGNPVRNSISITGKDEALKKFGLSSGRKTLLVLGGSLGARTINQAIEKALPLMVQNNIQCIWQTGRNYYDTYKQYSSNGIFVSAFIDDMNAAYSACDLLVSRAGATTIAEVSALGIPAILVPSPNVSENHQFYNAKGLADKEAAVLIEDKNAVEKLGSVIQELITNPGLLSSIKENALKFSRNDAAEVIASRAIKMVEEL
jgi:UDP-N-acetylglucosamine--N-acetylmuramyl-(pentapeptide) pyrophosphoryl-undecaprenol N-acetylglucosamine transferase